MPTYKIEQYEINSLLYRVEAETEALAIKKLLDGCAEPVDNGLEYTEVADDLGDAKVIRIRKLPASWPNRASLQGRNSVDPRYHRNSPLGL
ncbi:MAG: hypothetical protein SGJ20_20855, partial [Planctomycetota bacterium]|nr:hypothetical protein [Planctomycetota bacterium]